jgi:disulfide oxidoreductase YuzD
MELNTTDSGIVIRPIKKLSEKALATPIAENTTLDDFLGLKCTKYGLGEFSLYHTNEWSYFRFLAENRYINEAHVEALMDSFTKDGYLFTILFVNEKMEIIDGQHRFEAARRSKLPVYFMVMPGWGIKEVTILNVNSRNWTIVDFMGTHAKAGNPNYVRFKEFYDAHEFEITVCQLIVAGKRSRGTASLDKFRTGMMVVDDQQITDAYLRAKRIMELKQFHPHGWRSRNFVEAMLTLFRAKNYDNEHLIDKLKLYPEVLLLHARSLRIEEYLKLLLDKYNFRRTKNRIDPPRRH